MVWRKTRDHSLRVRIILVGENSVGIFSCMRPTRKPSSITIGEDLDIRFRRIQSLVHAASHAIIEIVFIHRRLLFRYTNFKVWADLNFVHSNFIIS